MTCVIETQVEESARDDQLKNLRTYLESYDIDFVDDLDACVHAYDKPQTLEKYVRNMSKADRKMIRADFLRAKIKRPPELTDVIVDNVRIRNKINKNWVIVNAPLDCTLVNKLIASQLSPIQMVFFHDADPIHEELLKDEMSSNERTQMFREIFEHFKNGTRHGTLVKRTTYPDFLQRLKSEQDTDEEENHVFEDESGIVEDDPEEHSDAISDDRPKKFIPPEVTERLDKYSHGLLEQWKRLKKLFHNKTDQYMEFDVIECKPGLKINPLQILIEDTLYHIKK